MTKSKRVTLNKTAHQERRTHSLLKAMLVKHPRVFHDTRLYTNKGTELQERKQSSFGKQVGGTNK